jgi:hypothetical protein
MWFAPTPNPPALKKTEAAIKAATDTPQLLAFACVMVCSFPNSELINGCVATEPRDRGHKRPASPALPVKIAYHCWF